MLAERPQEAVHALHPSVLHEAHEQIVIERELKIPVDAADFLIDPPPPETRFLRNIIPSLHHPGVMRRQNPIPRHAIPLVDKYTMAVDRIDLGMLRQESSGKVESPRGENIVAVEIRHDLAAGMFESARHRIGLASIRSRFAIRQTILIAGQN